MSQREWDSWYLDLCTVVAKNSKCLSRHIGAILVRDKAVISQGYNGPPRGLPHCGIRHQFDEELLREYEKDDSLPGFDHSLERVKCPRYILGYKSGEGLDLCVAGHAEANTLINAARMGISTKGTKMYMNCGIPCTPCMVKIINAGVEEIIVTKISYYDRSAEYVLKNSKIKYRVYDHLIKGKENEGTY